MQDGHNYADLHCHPGFKNTLKSIEPEKQGTAWDNVSIDANRFLPIFNSQSSLTQIKEGGVRIVVVGLYALERGFARTDIVRMLAFTSPEKVDIRVLNRVARKEVAYFQILKEKIQILERSNLPPERSAKIINSLNQITGPGIYLVLAAEGGHNFYGQPNKKSRVDNDPQESKPETVLANLLTFKQSNTYRLLYITLTHLCLSAFCNHAYGMKLFNNDSFFPKGRGINQLGFSFIRQALRNDNGKRILIDIKHMSLRSRQEFYLLMQREFPGVPIVASHMGLTGVSWTDPPIQSVKREDNGVFVKYTRPQSRIKDVFFNPWSINLYNEDIVLIAQSGGIIGLSLDLRILGGQDPGLEIFSHEEFDKDIAPSRKKTFQEEDDGTLEDDGALEDESVQRRTECNELEDIVRNLLDKEPYYTHVCNHILHIVEIASKVVGQQAWDCICIGSDFDGLIAAIGGCPTAADYPRLRAGLIKTLPAVTDIFNEQIPEKENKIPLYDVEKTVDKIMFGNLYAFMQKHFV